MTEIRDILLVAINARYAHCAYAARSLLANLGPWRSRAEVIECEADVDPVQLAGDIAARRPAVLGFSVYLWNTARVRATLEILHRAMPQPPYCVLGGPEIVAGAAAAWQGLADVLVVGEGETAFRNLCAARLKTCERTDSQAVGTEPAPPSSQANGMFRELEGRPPCRPPILSRHPSVDGGLSLAGVTTDVVSGGEPDLARLELPYDLYTDDDLAHRTIYAEISRGCPFRCRYCTSCVTRLRLFPWPRVRPEIERLLARGARRVKFLDRSFNADADHAAAVLTDLYARLPRGAQLHFEIMPTRLDDRLRRLVASFPAGALHLEVGLQTLLPAIARRVGRPDDVAGALETLRFLVRETGAVVHADLIYGLPGESAAEFGRGFDAVVAIGPAELQVNRLKLLPGTPLAEEAAAQGLTANPNPPYEVLRTDALDFAALTELQRFARCWDLLRSRERLAREMPRLWQINGASPFARVSALAARIHAAEGRLHALPEARVAAHLENLVRDAD